MTVSDEGDVSALSAELLVKQFVDKHRKYIDTGKKLRGIYSPEQVQSLEDSHNDASLDELNVAFAISKMSRNSIDEWERYLNLIESMVEEDVSKIMSYADVKLVNLFIMFLADLKPRSRRHLENFLECITEGVWADGFILGKGNDSEFRYLDHADEEVRKHFGLGSKD